MFSYTSSFNGDVSKWDVSGVTSMRHMFSNAKLFNCDISEWDVSGVTDMDYMFWGASSFKRKWFWCFYRSSAFLAQGGAGLIRCHPRRFQFKIESEEGKAAEPSCHVASSSIAARGFMARR